MSNRAMSGPRRLLFVSGVVALCAWVLVPIYLIGARRLRRPAGASSSGRRPVGPGNASLDAMPPSCASRACGTPR